MNDLRKAAEMALEVLMQKGEHHPKVYRAAEALRQALDDKPPVKTYCGGRANYCTPEEAHETPPCKTHPDAPHGFDRNASHNADRYVCECEGWEPPEETFILDRGCYERGCVAYDERDGDGVYISEKRVHKSDKSIHELDLEAPPKRDSSSWVGLTDKEWYMIWRHSTNLKNAIEEKLREKNHR